MNSKRKGGAFEREVCKFLSLWLSDGVRDDLLWRSAMSGGRATVRLGKGLNSPHVSGDICAVHPEGNIFVSDFYSECKDYKNLALEQFATEQSGLLVEFWLTAVEEAGKHEKLPMLIFHQARRPICVALSSAGVQYLNTEKHVFLVAPVLDMHILHFDKLTTLTYPRVRG